MHYMHNSNGNNKLDERLSTGVLRIHKRCFAWTWCVAGVSGDIGVSRIFTKDISLPLLSCINSLVELGCENSNKF